MSKTLKEKKKLLKEVQKALKAADSIKAFEARLREEIEEIQQSDE
jgi:hypothetical protein